MALPVRERSLTMSSAVWIQYTNVTDGRTDGRTRCHSKDHALRRRSGKKPCLSVSRALKKWQRPHTRISGLPMYSHGQIKIKSHNRNPNPPPLERARKHDTARKNSPLARQMARRGRRDATYSTLGGGVPAAQRGHTDRSVIKYGGSRSVR